MQGRRVLTISVILVVLISACASTTTRKAFIEPEVIQAEQVKQRQLAVAYQIEQQRRLDDIAYPILVSATPLCPDDVIIRTGFKVSNRYDYEDEWRPAAEVALGLDDSLRIVVVSRGSAAARVGLEPGDVLLELDGWRVPVGEDALEDLQKKMEALVAEDRMQIPLTWSRDEAVHSDLLISDRACRYSTHVIDGGELNAFADGDRILVDSTMLRFTEDDELAVVVAHELAHNAMGHTDARGKNTLFGAVLGAIGDVALAAAGHNTGGYYTLKGAEIGSFAYSQDFEREADYVGLYALALTGYDFLEAPTFWRHMAMVKRESIAFAFSHPTSAERFVRMEHALQEIQAKVRNHQALRPEMKND